MAERVPSSGGLPARELARLERVIRAAVHLMCNEVASISGQLELAALRSQEPDVRRSLVATQDQAIALGDRLRAVAAALRVPRPDGYEYVPVRDIVDGAVAPLLQETAGDGKPIVVERNLQADGLEALVCPALILEALRALLWNSREAGATRIAVSAGIRRGKLAVEVADQGEGIPEEALVRVLEPFFTTRAPPHWGMGLALAGAVASHHGGRLTVASRGRGQGARASLLLNTPWRIVQEPGQKSGPRAGRRKPTTTP